MHKIPTAYRDLMTGENALAPQNVRLVLDAIDPHMSRRGTASLPSQLVAQLALPLNGTESNWTRIDLNGVDPVAVELLNSDLGEALSFVKALPKMPRRGTYLKQLKRIVRGQDSAWLHDDVDNGASTNNGANPFGGSGTMPVDSMARTWISGTHKQYADVELEGSKDWIVPGQNNTDKFQAIHENVVLSTKKRDKVRAFIPLLNQHLKDRGIASCLPRELKNPLLSAIAASSVYGKYNGPIDLDSVPLPTTGDAVHMGLIEAVAAMRRTECGRYASQEYFFHRVADAMRADPQSLVVWHLQSRGVSAYTPEGLLRSGLSSLIKAVGNSELKDHGGSRKWLVNLENMDLVPELPVVEALGTLAEKNAWQPVAKVLDTYCNAVLGVTNDDTSNGTGGSGRRYGDYTMSELAAMNQAGVPFLHRIRQALPQSKTTFAQTLAQRLPAFFNARWARV